MRRPSKLRIMGNVWPIRWRTTTALDCAGTTDYDRARIDIAADQTPFNVRDTALHEAIHALLAQAGHTSYGNPAEEKFVRATATGLIGLFQDNPKFAQWLTEPLTK